MLVENNTLLNILLPNDNKVLKEALKQADSNTIEQFAKNNSSINDLLKNLFDDLKNGVKSNSNIENILKSSPMFKEMGTFSNSLSSLIENLSKNEDPNLQKFKPLLENFLKNIKDLDENSLKEQMKNSGVFLESKMAQTTNSKLENILNQIQNLIKDINTPQAKETNDLIAKLLQKQNQTSTDLKGLNTALQNLNNSLTPSQTQSLSTLSNQLKNIVDNGSLIESKMENNPLNTNLQTKENINLQAKELLNQLKNEITQNPSLQNKNILSTIENLLKMDNLFSKVEDFSNQILQNNLSSFSNNFASNISPLLNVLKESLENSSSNDPSLQTHLNKFIDKIEHIIKELSNPDIQKKENLNEDVKSILLKMQEDLSSKTDTKSQELSKQVDKLLNQLDFQQLLSITSNSNSVYLPFFWEMMDDGKISMKKTDENKFFCQINLTLKDFGKVDLMLALYDKNKLDLTVYAQREHFKTAIRDNIQKLKVALNNINLIPVNIKLLDLKDNESTKDKPTQVYNSYNQNTNLNFLDIRA